MKKKIVLLLLLFNLNSFSQEKFSRSIELNTDNDLYVSVKKDRYYTSGVFLKYQFIGNKKRVLLEKRIYEFQVGHEMFSPYKAIVQDISQHDRPFAAHLFTQFKITNTFKSNQILKTSLQFGIIGSSALGKELQDFIHNIYGFQKAIGWKYQIKDALSLNASLDYVKSISTNASKNIDLNIYVLKQEIITKSEGKQGLILLAGNMLSLGITINSDVNFLYVNENTQECTLKE